MCIFGSAESTRATEYVAVTKGNESSVNCPPPSLRASVSVYTRCVLVLGDASAAQLVLILPVVINIAEDALGKLLLRSVFCFFCCVMLGWEAADVDSLLAFVS